MRKTKLLCCALIGSFLITPIAYVNANDTPYYTTNVSDEYTFGDEVNEKLVNQLAEALAIIDKANKVDYQGNIRNIDFKMLRNYFGNSELIDTLEKEFKYNKENRTWTSCMLSAIKDQIGVSAISALMVGGLVSFLQKKAWKEAAKLIIKVVGKGVVGGVFVWAGFFAYYSVICMFD